MRLDYGKIMEGEDAIVAPDNGVFEAGLAKASGIQFRKVVVVLDVKYAN